jgi:transcriptional regulator GlxA family with amidase domain
MDMKLHHETAVQAAFIIPPKVHLLDVTGPIQIFYEAACNGAPFKLLYGAIFPEQTESAGSCMLSFNRLIPYDQINLNKGDYLFVPGMDHAMVSAPRFLMESRPFQHWLTVQHQKGVIICCVCTGAFLLGSAGLLDGRACTTHWEYSERLKLSYPKIRLQTNRLFVYDANIYTSAGVASSIDLALYLVERLCGAHFAAKIAKEAVVYFRRTIDDPQLSVFTQYRNHLDHRIHKVQDILMQSLGHRFTIEEIATQVNMSGRNLTRLFKKTTDITIGGYLDQLRVEHAERLIGEGHTLQATALHCGLKSTNQLHHLLTRYRVIKNSA